MLANAPSLIRAELEGLLEILMIGPERLAINPRDLRARAERLSAHLHDVWPEPVARAAQRFAWAGLSIDLAAHEVFVDQQRVTLTPA